MTPFELEIVLHYYSRAEDWRGGDFSAPIAISTLEEFVRLGLLAKPGEYAGMQYGRTEMLDVFVQHLCNQPLPVQKWVIPQ